MPKVPLDAYDVLQVQQEGRWLDFSTLRSEQDFARAIQLVDTSKWEGMLRTFRVTNMTKTVVKYPSEGAS